MSVFLWEESSTKFKNLETANVEFHYINEYDSIFNDNFEAYKELFFIEYI